ncbi:MAG TPA: methionine adenosyltransferase, partial [Acidimicrobiia bacterium]|nr:methionine adenosyltransferase [Acidimicrobiia bacterium]
MQPRQHLFTSESVSQGHPDKAADQVSDAVLDAVLGQDPEGRVACEVLLTRGLAVVAGEVTADAEVDYEAVLRTTMADIGYTSDDIGFSADDADVRLALSTQSPDIARGVKRDDGTIGAGDQGLMFGYACAQTPELMPLPITLAHALIARQNEVRHTGLIPHLRPDAKSQVTVTYEGPTPVEITSVVVSTQHGPEWSENQDELTAEVIEKIMRPVLGDWWSDTAAAGTKVNPTGRFEYGGPASDTGLTGRKIIVDTYGGWARHGGGAFSGKDATKVDRSAAYMARHVAKSVVAAGLADECELRLSYIIGVAEPSAVSVDCKGSNRVDEARLERVIREVFPLTPEGIIEYLDLRRPIYRPTSFHGHYGRTPDDATGAFSWERTDHAEDL